MNDNGTKDNIQPIFQYRDSSGGIFCPEFELAPWPGFIFRRQAILDQIQLCMPKKGETARFIELGYGSGILSYEFYRRNFECYGFDYSELSLKTANAVFNSDKHRICFKPELTEDDHEKYDVLGAFEILEHVPDDSTAFSSWIKLLKPNGKIILSVPARMKFWCYRDLRTGHQRRYEREQLIQLCTKNGLQIDSLISYGFPVLNLLLPIADYLVHKPEYMENISKSKEDLTKVSGIKHTREYSFRKWIPFRTIVALAKLHRVFYKTNLGSGYVLVATRRP